MVFYTYNSPRKMRILGIKNLFQIHHLIRLLEKIKFFPSTFTNIIFMEFISFISASLLKYFLATYLKASLFISLVSEITPSQSKICTIILNFKTYPKE